jgi:hypothetical protein
MIKYQKRQLPPLQRYNNLPHIYPEINNSPYWDMENDYQRGKRYSQTFGNIWQKFIVTFALILSLVCISWLVYNWKTGNGQRYDQTPVIIEPEQPSFKVLPEDSGETDNPYRNRSVYERLNPGTTNFDDDKALLPPQEKPVELPKNNIEENSIIDDKAYYIKISAGKSKTILENELKILRKKFAVILKDTKLSVKKVSNPKGEQKYAILIGPFESQESAFDIAKNINEQCYIISVKE